MLRSERQDAKGEETALVEESASEEQETSLKKYEEVHAEKPKGVNVEKKHNGENPASFRDGDPTRVDIALSVLSGNGEENTGIEERRREENAKMSVIEERAVEKDGNNLMKRSRKKNRSTKQQAMSSVRDPWLDARGGEKEEAYLHVGDYDKENDGVSELELHPRSTYFPIMCLLVKKSIY